MTCWADIGPPTQSLANNLAQKKHRTPPTILHSFLCLLLSQVENPSQFIQGYRVLYRQTSGLPSPGPWQIQDLRVASERDITLSDLKKGIVYEIKVRPYFNEFQGADSESMTTRTMEEGKWHIIHMSWKNKFFPRLNDEKKPEILLLMHEVLALCLSRLLYLVATSNGSLGRQ